MGSADRVVTNRFTEQRETGSSGVNLLVIRDFGVD